MYTNQVVNGEDNFKLRIRGDDNNYADIYAQRMQDGDEIMKAEVEQSKHYIVDGTNTIYQRDTVRGDDSVEVTFTKLIASSKNRQPEVAFSLKNSQ